MIADGPGAAYLKANCPQRGFEMCRFVDRLPVNRVSAFPFTDTWRTAHQNVDDAFVEIFSASDPDTRRSLAGEQYSFALATLSYDLVGETVAALRNTIIQLGSFELKEFAYPKIFFTDRVPRRYLEVMKGTKAWAGEMPTQICSILVLTVTIVSALYIAGFLVYNFRANGRDCALARFVKVILLGVLLNAFICGALSGPYDRYQARVIWLVPLIAALAYHQQRVRYSKVNGLAHRIHDGIG